MRRLIYFVCFFLLLAVGCTKTNEEELLLQAKQQELCSKDTISFSQDVVPIIREYCISCHSASLANGSVVMENYDQISTLASSGDLMGSINHDPGYTAMPNDGRKLTSCETRALNTWISQGVKNN